MARVRVRHSIDALAADMASIPARAAREERSIVRQAIKLGNAEAKEFAKRSSGAHGKLYPKTFTAEMHGGLSAVTGGRLVSGEYGPDPALPQGGMSFEFGSRNQKPHLDLARSADLIGPAMAGEVGRMVDRLFW